LIWELQKRDVSLIKDLVEKTLKSDPRLARKAAIYFCRKYSDRSFGELGEYFEGMSVSALNQVVRRFDQERSAERLVERKIRKLEKEILKKCNV
jgi:chromosomal replication initiation ATPase DnaA